jgi:hypothetical protein
MTRTSIEAAIYVFLVLLVVTFVFTVYKVYLMLFG